MYSFSLDISYIDKITNKQQKQTTHKIINSIWNYKSFKLGLN